MSLNNTVHPAGITKRKLYQSGNPVVQKLLNGLLSGIHELFFEIAPARVLDVGCGIGHVMSTLKEAGTKAEFTGVELDEGDAVIYRERHPDIPLYTIPLEQSDFEPESFDLVMATEVLEHTEDPSEALRVMARFTKGPLLLTVPWEPFFCLGNFLRGQNIARLGDDPEHLNHWTRRGFERFLRNEGFLIKKKTGPFPMAAGARI